jgi:hypothetical protein
MFGFKHTMDNLEHDRIDHKAVRNRLNNRVIEVKGREQLEGLYPHVLTRFQETLQKEIDNGRSSKGNTLHV